MPSKVKSQARYEAYHKMRQQDKRDACYAVSNTVYRWYTGVTASKWYVAPKSVSRLKPKTSGRNGQVMPME
jgi:hypothetical protein